MRNKIYATREKFRFPSESEAVLLTAKEGKSTNSTGSDVQQSSYRKTVRLGVVYETIYYLLGRRETPHNRRI